MIAIPEKVLFYDNPAPVTVAGAVPQVLLLDGVDQYAQVCILAALTNPSATSEYAFSLAYQTKFAAGADAAESDWIAIDEAEVASTAFGVPDHFNLAWGLNLRTLPASCATLRLTAQGIVAESFDVALTVLLADPAGGIFNPGPQSGWTVVC